MWSEQGGCGLGKVGVVRARWVARLSVIHPHTFFLMCVIQGSQSMEEHLVMENGQTNK